MQGEDGLAVFGEHHEIGFPVAGRVRIAGFGGALGDGDRPSMKLAGLPPLLPRQPRLALGAGR